MSSHVRLSRRAFLQATAAAAPLVGVGVVAPATVFAAGLGNGQRDRPRGHILVPSAGEWSDPDPHALAQRAVDAAVAAGAQYADARLTVIVRETWFEGEITTPLHNYELYGVGVRALWKGCWGFFSSAVWTPDEMVRLGQGAVAQARASLHGAVRDVSMGFIPPVVNGSWIMPVKYDPFTISLAEKSDYMDAMRGIIHRHSPLVAGGMSATFQRTRKYFASSEGSSWMQTTYVTEGSVNLRYNAEYGYNKINMGFAGAKTVTPAGQGWEYLSESGLPEQIPALIDLAEQSRDTAVLEVGKYDIVCEPYAVASMVSDTIGAATELDRAMGFEANADGTSFIDEPLDMLGHFQMGSTMLNISANRSQPGAAATVRWDDEAVVPDEFPIITNGILTDFQTTREQAAWIRPYYEQAGKRVQSHGCASGPSGTDITMQHAPNFRIHGGAKATTYEDLIASTERGIAVLDVNLRMDQQCLNGIGFGTFREIKKGKLGRFLFGGVLAVRTPELWKSLVGIGSDDTTRWFGRMRGKGEPAQGSYHSVGAVPAKFSNVTVVNLYGSF